MLIASIPDLKPFIVLGLALGGVFAMSGVGLVVLYRATGVLNLAYGAIGAVGALVAWSLLDRTGTPEPGGLTSGELLWAARTVAAGLDVVGADVVEVIPTAVGSADITALVAERIAREVMTGIALRRR